jgi:hypothetical protein
VLNDQHRSSAGAERGDKPHDWHDRRKLQASRIMVSLLIPVVLYFYSPWLAAIVAVPCWIACYWYVSQSVRKFLKK